MGPVLTHLLSKGETETLGRTPAQKPGVEVYACNLSTQEFGNRRILSSRTARVTQEDPALKQDNMPSHQVLLPHLLSSSQVKTLRDPNMPLLNWTPST